MSGNVPNVSRDGYNYSHTLSGGKSVLYDGISLQQGVPVVDSDINESQDYRRVNEQLFHKMLLGANSGILFGSTPALSGFTPYQASSPQNNFSLRAGYAIVEGVVVPTTTATTPAAFDYKDQVLYSGLLTGISGSDLEDDSKNWSSSDELIVSAVSPKHVACIIKITSGTENNHWGYLLAYTATTVTINTSTQVNRNDGSSLKTLITPANINIGDSYEIYVPPLTTPGGARTDYVYLQTWFDDICEDEDSAIVNTDVGVEAVHKIAKRWAVRVSEDGGPTFTSSFTTFAHKYFLYAYFSRTATGNITTAMINLSSGTRTFGNLTQINPTSIEVDFTDMTAAGYHTSGITANVQEAIDLLATELYSTTAGYGASRVRNATIAGSPDTLPSGAISTMISSLLGFVNNRVRSYEPTIAADLLSGGPVLLWRSHGAIANSTVTKDTVSIYVVQTSSSIGGIAEVVGGYLDGANCYRAPTGTAPTYVTMRLHSRTGFYDYFKEAPSASPWAWESAWDSSFARTGGICTFQDINVAIHDGIFYLNGSHISLSSGITSSTPKKIISSETSVTVPSATSAPGLWASSDGMWVTQNCYYSGGKWNCHVSSRDSYATHFTDGGTNFYCKIATENATPWDRTGVSVSPLTTKWTYCQSMYGLVSLVPQPYVLSGLLAEYVPFTYHGYVPSGGTSGVVHIPINFNFPRAAAPTVPTYGAGRIVLSTETRTDTSSNVPLYFASVAHPEKGGALVITSDGALSPGDSFYGTGYLLIA